MVLAHALGGTGPEIELVVLSAVGIIYSIVGYVRKDLPRRAFLLTFGISLVFFIAAFAFAPQTSAPPTGTSISITFPSPGQTVSADRDVDVDVALTGAHITSDPNAKDPRAGHIHIYVDNKLVSMPTELENVVDLTPGRHEIAVEYVAGNHQGFSPPVLDKVTVTAR